MNLNWHELDRQELPKILIGDGKISGQGASRPMIKEWAAAIGTNPLNGVSSVALTIVGKSRGELFSWLSTYSEEVFPLSQFCRVCTVEDWQDLDLLNYTATSLGPVHPAWTSVILGEMLGQADAEFDVANVPLGRAAACFSFAIARASLLYPKHELALQKCIARMESIENESRFARRHISVESLKKIWSAAIAAQKSAPRFLGVVEAILQIVANVNPSAANFLRNNKDLLSDSAETRIIGFDNVVDTFFEMRNSDTIGREGGAIALAAAALLVGRGTSHIQLLAPAAKVFPETVVWYGLLAGVMGPRHWDISWIQKTKGIEKSLRQYFCPDEPVMADLCWPEYDWISKTYDSAESFSSIPKNAPRNMAIEILPGVNCQFRLAGGEQPTQSIDEPAKLAVGKNQRVPSVSEDTLERVKQLLGHVQDLLKTPLDQKQLFSNEPDQKRSVRRKTSSKPKGKD